MLLEPKIAANAVALLTGSRRRGPDPFPSLTDREQDVLELVAEGLDDRRIAHRLASSGKTVRNNLSMVLTKLGVTDRAAAIAKRATPNSAHAVADTRRESDTAAPRERVDGAVGGHERPRT